MDLDRITNPLRLARGSHQPGSGKGCAMNVISYIEGDEEITDFPATSARPLASFVQLCNDLVAEPDGFLSPKNSLLVLDLAWLTVGTADVADSITHIWVTKLLTSPPWGVLRYAGGAAAQAIADIADLHRTFAPGDVPSIVNWDGAARAGRAAAEACEGAELFAVRAACQSTALVETDDWDTLDAVTGNALRAHRLANGEAGAARMVDVTRNAIRSWRRLAGLSVVSNDPIPTPGVRPRTPKSALPVAISA
jgi:hypothetical protein